MMDPLLDSETVVEIIRSKFVEEGKPVQIPLQRKRSFGATLKEGGIKVTNLGTQPFLPWAIFKETIKLLQVSDGCAERGDAMSAKLGKTKLPFNSIEGHIAHVVYNKKEGGYSVAANFTNCRHPCLGGAA